MKREIILKTDKIPYYLEKGKDHKDWYKTESEKLINLLPEFEGLPIIRCFAVTSMTTNIEANVHLALKALCQMKKGLPFMGYLPVMQDYLYISTSGKDVKGRKIMNFIRALEGDVDAVVVDIWMTHTFGTIQERALRGRTYYRSPSKAEYDKIEDYIKFDAYIINCDPREYQSMVWAGIKSTQSTISKNVTWSDLLLKKKGMFSFIY
jgi:uncharacterized protein YbaA (DUF1428 family)